MSSNNTCTTLSAGGGVGAWRVARAGGRGVQDPGRGHRSSKEAKRRPLPLPLVFRGRRGELCVRLSRHVYKLRRSSIAIAITVAIFVRLVWPRTFLPLVLVVPFAIVSHLVSLFSSSVSLGWLSPSRSFAPGRLSVWNRRRRRSSDVRTYARSTQLN